MSTVVGAVMFVFILDFLELLTIELVCQVASEMSLDTKKILGVYAILSYVAV